MKIYLITDTHLDHKKLIEWGRPEDFEERIKKSLKRLAKGDLLIHLGDICIGNDEANNRIFTDLPCHKILVRGNHDEKSTNWYLDIGWDFVCETFRMRHKGKEIVFSHMPILAENIETSPYLKVDKNIHGHLHGRGRYSHRAIEGYDVGFHYDAAPDNHDFNLVPLDKIVR